MKEYYVKAISWKDNEHGIKSNITIHDSIVNSSFEDALISKGVLRERYKSVFADPDLQDRCGVYIVTDQLAWEKKV